MKEEKLLHLLRKKRGFFEAMLELAETEERASFHEWFSILQEKKILLSCVDEVDRELEFFKESLQFLSQEVTEELDQLKEVIQTILHIDAHNLEKRKKELKFHDESQ